MKIFNADRQKNLEINNLIQKIKYKAGELQSGEDRVSLPIFELNNGQLIYQMNPTDKLLLQKFKKWGIIELFERDLKELNRSLKNSKLKGLIVEEVSIKPIEPKFSQFCKKYEDKINEKSEKKINERLEEKNKKEIVIDLQKGIYDKKHPKSIYEISGKRKMIVEYLFNKTASLSDLVSVTGQKDQLISASIKEINRIFKKNCKIKNDLIVHSRTAGGYKLNKDELELKIIKTST